MKRLAVVFYKFEDFHVTKEYLLTALRNRGHKITVFTTKNISIENPPYNIVSLSERNYYSGEWLKERKYDILFLYHLNFNHIKILKKAKDIGIKIITKADSNGFFPLLESDIIRNSFYYQSKRLIKAFLNYNFKLKMNELLNLNDYVMLETSTGYRRFITSFQEHHEKFKIIPYGFSFKKGEFNQKVKKIIAIGRWEDIKQKKIRRLLKAFSRLKGVWNGYELYIIGTCSKKIINKYEGNYVHFLGWKTREEIDYLLLDSQITIMSSEWESFGYVQIEALSKGNTVVSTPHVGAIDVIHGFEFGLVAQGYSTKELSSALSAEISLWVNGERDPELIFEKAKEYYDWSVICTQIEELF